MSSMESRGPAPLTVDSATFTKLVRAIECSDPRNWTAKKTTMEVSFNIGKEPCSVMMIAVPVGSQESFEICLIERDLSRSPSAVFERLFSDIFKDMSKSPFGQPVTHCYIAYGDTRFQGPKAEELYQKAKTALAPLTAAAQNFLADLGRDPHKALEYPWGKSFSQDERIKTYTANIDGFALSVKGVENFVLGQDIGKYEVAFSMKECLIGPFVVTGDKAKAIFKALEEQQ